jgi:N-acetylglucosaminyl-diphospho-decaprenol L-rhamnosyltransferase
MRVLACIVNFRTADLTLRAVESLVPELRALPGSRVCVVDNDSQDGSYERLCVGVAQSGFDDVAEVVASGHNGGFGFGNNVALRRGLSWPEPPDYFYLLNPDAFIEPGALRTLGDYMQSHPDVGIAGGFVSSPDGQPNTAAFTFPSVLGELEGSVQLSAVTKLLRKHVVPRPIPKQTTDDVDWVSGASMMLRRSVLQRVGLFDETYFLYFEETDLCRRVRDAGYKIAFVPEAKVVHHEGSSTGITNKRRRTPGYLLDSRRLYFLKHHGRPYLWAANAARAAGTVGFELHRRLRGKDAPGYERALPDFVAHWLKHP